MSYVQDESEETNVQFFKPNPHLDLLTTDVMYHLGLDTKTHNLPKLFGDVRYVFLGGTGRRMLRFAEMVKDKLQCEFPIGSELSNISEQAHRYSMYKVGSVLSVSHGIGASSLGILLHELIKLVRYAKCHDPIFIRLGTCGGLGLEPGTVVISTKAVDGVLRPYYELPILGRLHRCPSIFDRDLVDHLVNEGSNFPNFKTVKGITMCCNDFYEGQARVDGAFCSFNEQEKMDFLRDIYSKGVRNIEMESLPLGAFCSSAGIKSAAVCVTLINRLEGDQIDSCRELLQEFQDRPLKLSIEFLRSHNSLSK